MIRGSALAVVVLAGACFSKPGFGGGAGDAGGDVAGDGKPGDAPFATSFGEWQTPQSLGLEELSFHDLMPAVSSNKLELFFVSTRSGMNRLYVAKRPSPSDPYDNPVLVTANNEGETDPTLSPDGLDLYWFVLNTIKHAHRTSTSVDFSTESGVAFPAVGPFGFYGSGDRMVAGSTANPASSSSDIIELRLDGGGWIPRPDLQLPGAGVSDTSPTIRHDGLEIYYEHDATGPYQTYVATRTSADAPFSMAAQFQLGGMTIGDPELSRDGTELYFNANSPMQLFVVRRTPNP
ncbi:MAG: PD40 domain-containing protein [Myxococcales bacterium]|nr:PD40 domain-containing protein [Myxococcales bacterium]